MTPTGQAFCVLRVFCASVILQSDTSSQNAGAPSDSCPQPHTISAAVHWTREAGAERRHRAVLRARPVCAAAGGDAQPLDHGRHPCPAVRRRSAPPPPPPPLPAPSPP